MAGWALLCYMLESSSLREHLRGKLVCSITTTTTPIFFLKTIQCLAVTFNFGSKCGTKDRHWCEQNEVFNVWIRPPILDNLRLPESRGGCVHKPLGSWGVNYRDAHAYLQLFGINITFAMKKIDQLYFYLCFIFSKGKNAFYVSNPTFSQCEWANGEFYTTGP